MSHLHHRVSALIDGELQGAARRRALAHVRSCADCRRDIEETLALKRRLVGLRASEPSADLFATLDSPPAAAEPEPAAGRSLPSMRRLLTGAGSVSLVVLSIAYVVGAPQEAATASVPPQLDDFTADFAAGAGTGPLADPSVDALSIDAASAARPVSDLGLGAELTGPSPSGAGNVVIPAGDDPAAVGLLEAAALAPSLIAYVGVRRIVGSDGTVPLDVEVSVRHVPDQGTRFDVVSPDVATDPIFVGSGPAADPETPTSAELLESSYDVAVLGDDTVAGRRSVVIGVGRDGHVAARLWIDAETGVLMRRDSYADDALVRTSEFTSFQIRPNLFFAHVPPTLPGPTMEPLPRQHAAQYNDSGWTCPESVVDGWHLTALDRVESGTETIRAEYSDGLSTASIFEQRGALDPTKLAGFARTRVGDGTIYRRDGLPTQLVWESGDTVYTVITDAPAAVVDELLAGMPTEAAADDESGFASRVGSGLAKMVEFASPVG